MKRPGGERHDRRQRRPDPRRLRGLVRYPLTPGPERPPGQSQEEHLAVLRAERETWPWLEGTIEQQCGPDEWLVTVEDRRLAKLEDGSPAPEGTPAEELFWPQAYRDASEIQVARSIMTGQAGSGRTAGGRVVINSPDHPWNGHEGRIASRMHAPESGWDWEVALTGYPGCATTAAGSDLRPPAAEAGQ